MEGAASEVNIFTINNRERRVGFGATAQRVLQQLAPPPVERWVPRPLREQLRSIVDPGVREERKRVRQWRHWHEVFCTLNEIEQRLAEVIRRLVHATASLRHFATDQDTAQGRAARLLIQDAVLFRSRAETPQRLEAHLEELERAADAFRCILIDPDPSEAAYGVEGQGAEAVAEPRGQCEDLQVDVAVLLESSLMTAQQALAEYKKMHCRLELLAAEYESVAAECEYDAGLDPFLSLLADEGADAAASVPQRAAEWAMGFWDMVGTSSTGLAALVRELEHRARHLKTCADELRGHVLRRASGCGSAAPEI